VNLMPLAHLLWRLSEGRTSALERTYKAFVTSASKPWFTADDRAERRRDLEQSMRSAQAAVEIIGARPGISPALQGLRGKLVMLATLAKGDLKTPV
jgi:hypothetical protein